MRIEWNAAAIKKAQAELRKVTTVAAALGAISKDVGVALTEDGLYHAFKRHGVARPATFCKKAVVEVASKGMPENVAKLLKVTKSGPVSFESVCDKMSMSPKDCRSLIKKAQEEGYSFEVVHDSVAFKLPESVDGLIHDIKVAPTVGARHKVAVITDTHLGSKYCLRAQLKEFIEYAYKQGVREVLHVGDVLDGAYSHGMFELTHSGIDDQTQDLFETLPQLPGLQYFGITGNHDDTFSDKIGMDAGAFMQRYFENRGRNDLKFFGRRGAFLRLHGAVFELWHPKRGPGYALSYAIQNHIRDLPVGAKGDFLLVGHHHTWCYVEQRGVHALQCGTFQGGGSAFSKSLGGAPSIGGTLISWEATAGGTVRRVQIERSAYYEKEITRPSSVLP